MNFRELRMDIGIKVKKIAEEIGCSKAAIYAIETGKVTKGVIYTKYMDLLCIDPITISKINTGSLKQTDIEEIL